MTNQIVKYDEQAAKSDLYRDLEALIKRYKSKFPDSTTLLDWIIGYSMHHLEMRDTIKSNYCDSYADLYIQYAKTNLNPHGFFGKYLIDYTSMELWIKQHPSWKKAVALIPHITANLLNESVIKVFKHAEQEGDVKTITNTVMKMLDLQFKTEKDSGISRNAADKTLQAQKTGDTSEISDTELESMKQYVNT